MAIDSLVYYSCTASVEDFEVNWWSVSSFPVCWSWVQRALYSLKRFREVLNVGAKSNIILVLGFKRMVCTCIGVCLCVIFLGMGAKFFASLGQGVIFWGVSCEVHAGLLCGCRVLLVGVIG